MTPHYRCLPSSLFQNQMIARDRCCRRRIGRCDLGIGYPGLSFSNCALQHVDLLILGCHLTAVRCLELSIHLIHVAA